MTMTRNAPRRAGRPAGGKAKTREEVIAAGAAVFRRRGYHQARMDEVASALGITKASLYYYVASKEALLFEIVAAPYREAVAHAEATASSHLSAAERVRAIIGQHLTATERHYPAISIYLASSDLPVPEEMRDLDRSYSKALRSIMLEGMRDGSFRVLDPAVAVLSVIGMCNWFAVRFRPTDGWDVEEVAEEFAATCLQGLAA
jgi:AcrR family transcriptional regulator